MSQLRRHIGLASLGLVALALTLAVACGDDDDGKTAPAETATARTSPAAAGTRQSSPTATSTIARTPAGTATARTSPTAAGTRQSSPTATSTIAILPNVCQPNPSPAAAGVMAIGQPTLGANVTSPLRVAGNGVSTGGIVVTLYDAQGRVVATKNAQIDSSATPRPVPGGGESLPFTAELTFAVSRAEPACLWAHKTSGRDGSPTNVVQVPVQLVP